MRVVIIGGGISGLSAAASLARHVDVTVLERETAWGYHASGRSAAMFIPDYGNATVRALNAMSRPLIEGLGVLSQRGLLLVARPEAVADFEADAAEIALEDLPVEIAVERVPILNTQAIARAGYVDAAWDIDTDAMLQHCLRAARAEGATLMTGADVHGLSHAGSQWRVETPQGVFNGDVIINAGGAWADVIAQTASLQRKGLTPHRRSVARLSAPGGHDVRGWPMLLGAGESWYAKPDAGAWLVSPADEDPIEPHDAYASDMVLAEGLDRYQAHVTEPVTRVTSNWAGLRTFAPDRTPVIGPDPEERSFFWLAGQGGYGFQIALAAAELTKALVLKDTTSVDPSVIQALSPARAALS